MPIQGQNLATRASGDLITTVSFTGSTCIVTRHTPEAVRFWAAIIAIVLLLFTLISAVETRRWPWLLIIALFLLCLAIAAALVAVRPDRRIVFNAESSTVKIFRQYLWSATESM